MWARLFNKNVEDTDSSVVQGMTAYLEMWWIGGGLGVRARVGRESVLAFSYAMATLGACSGRQ